MHISQAPTGCLERDRGALYNYDSAGSSGFDIPIDDLHRGDFTVNVTKTFPDYATAWTLSATRLGGEITGFFIFSALDQSGNPGCTTGVQEFTAKKQG
jgi:hypothetical protein